MAAVGGWRLASAGGGGSEQGVWPHGKACESAEGWHQVPQCVRTLPVPVWLLV